jgi:2-dehydro-3-deoxygluconokinase
VLATTLRDVHSTNRHTWGAVAWIDGQSFVAPTCSLDVYDRVGGGDSFASGLFYGLLTGESPEESVKLGWAHGALATTFPGDTTMATLAQVRAFAKGGVGKNPEIAPLRSPDAFPASRIVLSGEIASD